MVTPGNSLYFPGVEYIRSCVSKAATKQGGCSLPVIVDCRYVLGIILHLYKTLSKNNFLSVLFYLLGADFTAAKGIASLSEDFAKRKQPLIFYNPRETVVEVFTGACVNSFQYVNGPGELDRALNG